VTALFHCAGSEECCGARVRKWPVTTVAAGGRSGSAVWGTPASAATSGNVFNMPAFDPQKPSAPIYLISSSAVARSDSGTSMPSGLAVLDKLELGRTAELRVHEPVHCRRIQSRRDQRSQENGLVIRRRREPKPAEDAEEGELMHVTIPPVAHSPRGVWHIPHHRSVQRAADLCRDRVSRSQIPCRAHRSISTSFRLRPTARSVSRPSR
jgi:hypothetical protein